MGSTGLSDHERELVRSAAIKTAEVTGSDIEALGIEPSGDDFVEMVMQYLETYGGKEAQDAIKALRKLPWEQQVAIGKEVL